MSPTIQIQRGAEYSRIHGLGVARGERYVTNDEVAGPIESSDEWIRSRTGIVTRVRAEESTSVLDLAEQAAREAIANAGIEASSIDAVLLSTISYPHLAGAGAPVIADRLGLTVPAHDIRAACAGYCYGIGQADAMVRSGAATYVLVIGAEKLSDFVDPADRSISFLLGDGAGAVVVGPSDFPGIGPTIAGSDGSGAHLVAESNTWLDIKNDRSLPFPTLRQEGPSVFKWASFKMAPVAREAIEKAGLTPEDIDAFIPHQANIRIIEQMVKQIGLPESVVVAKDIADSGNTSAASIPLATERLYRDGAVKSGDIALQIGFGAGLVYAAQVIVLP